MRTAVKKNNGGYFTIEAVFIGTITCFLVMAFWLIALYLLDLGAADSYLKEQLTMLSAETVDAKQGFVGSNQNDLQKRLLVCDIDTFRVRRNGNSIYGEVQISMDFPIPIVGDWLGKRWKNRLSITLEKGNNQTKMRRWDQIE